MELGEISGQHCPDCGQSSLEYDPVYKLYECKNGGCGSVFNQKDLDRERGILPVTEPMIAVDREHTPAYWRRIDLEPISDYINKTNKTSTATALAIIAGSVVTAIIMVFVVYPLLNTSSGLPIGFTVTAGNMQNSLSWDHNASADGVTVVYSTLGYPASPSDGIQLYSGDGTSFIHEELEYNIKYYYAIWSRTMVDGEPQYSEDYVNAAGIPYWRGSGGEAINEYVDYDDIYRVAGADGEYIELINNPEAQDITWSQLKGFLREDDSDKEIYEDDLFVCADFAEVLHNNAEELGIRAAYVVITFVDKEAGHACNAFYTTDLGLIYIDTTGTDTGDVNADKRVEISVGQQYSPTAVFPRLGPSWDNLGEVDEYWVIW